MTYAIQLWPHANIRYMESLQKLALCELSCLLKANGIDAAPRYECIGGAPFMVFDCDELSPAILTRLKCHSAQYLICEKQGDMLKPLSPEDPYYLNNDIAEILKYKGKTNASFTMMMLSCALSAGAFYHEASPITVLDPLCGKGTTLFCALRRGDNAVGIELDRKDVKECSDYFAKYLQLYKFKHQKTLSSLTLPKRKSAPKTAFVFANDPEAYKQADTRSLELILGDTLDASLLLKPESVHLIAADLPYGVQHAPEGGAKKQTFMQLMAAALPGWRKALKTGGTMALAFNTYTTDKQTLIAIVEKAGFTVLRDAPYNDFDHYVEQAVNRDLIIATK